MDMIYGRYNCDSNQKNWTYIYHYDAVYTYPSDSYQENCGYMDTLMMRMGE